jgi:hypothetical protein
MILEVMIFEMVSFVIQTSMTLVLNNREDFVQNSSREDDE